MHFTFADPSLTVALALAVGVLAQVLAVHMRLPGVVVLLAAGVALGPDGANIIQPSSLGGGLQQIVGFAVAVILFEGGLHLELKKLKQAGRAIRQLITVGALATALAGTLVGWLVMGLPLRLAILFGTLIIVTGPTVITPLLKRLRVKRTVSTVLEAEGVLIDAVGAIIAAVALEIAISPSGENVALGALSILARLGTGAGLGLAGGLFIALLLRFHQYIPDGLENILTLCLMLALFQVSNGLLHESGIAAVTVAGVVVGNSQSRVQRTLVEFKVQLTAMLIGLLFVLLAADVRISDVIALGKPGLLTVLAVIILVRPLNVAVGTFRTELTTKERIFIAWIGPRGIVAAAVASLFATRLALSGIEGGTQLRALVFLVIAITVTWAGLTGGFVARLLKLRKPENQGWAILGANEVARTVARLLQQSGEEVVCIESNVAVAAEAEADGLQVVVGNGLKEPTLEQADIDIRAGVIGLTSNEQLNFLFAQHAKDMAKKLRLFVSIIVWDEGITPDLVHKLGGEVFSSGAEDIAMWSARIRRGRSDVQWWRLAPPDDGGEHTKAEAPNEPEADNSPFLPLVTRGPGGVSPVGDTSGVGAGRAVAFLLDTSRLADAEAALGARGYTKL